SSVLPLSIAAPMAGTCDGPTPATILATAHVRFADLDLDFGLLFLLAVGLLSAEALALAALTFEVFAPAAFFPAAPAINDAGLFLPVRERLPSTDRPPPSIILA